MLAQSATEPTVDSGPCPEKVTARERWYVICLKECDDIAAEYAYEHRANKNAPMSFQRELDGCLEACHSKNRYYKDDLC